MKPFGFKPVHFPGKTDCHPRKGFVNWWENEMAYHGKAIERRYVRKEIQNGILEFIEDKT